MDDARMTGKAIDTIIEDSEPERVAEAARERKARRARKKLKQKQKEDESSTSLTRDVVPFTEHETCVAHSLAMENEFDVILPSIHMSIRECPSHDVEVSNFKHFISQYTHSQPRSSRQSASIAVPEFKIIKVATDKPKKVPKATFFCLSSLPKIQLAKLNRCYVCNLSWTSRKTVPAKLTHVKSCAIKHGWSEDTLSSVFNKELHAADHPERSNSLPDSVTRLGPSHGLLEDIIDGTTACRKQSKGRSRQTSTLDPTRAHSAIVERVKNMFDSNEQLNLPSEAHKFPSTQIFQPSKLNSATRGLLARAMREEEAKCDISITQKSHSLSDWSNPVPCSHPVSRRPSSSLRSTSVDILSISRTSGSADFLTKSEAAIDEINRRLRAIQLPGTINNEQQQDTKFEPTSLPPQSTAYFLPFEDPQKKINCTHDNVHDVDERLRRTIKRNDELYGRILRYEPLHIDTFLTLDDVKETIDGQGFKNKLRAFLDKHCINFYTDSALESNRSRR